MNKIDLIILIDSVIKSGMLMTRWNGNQVGWMDCQRHLHIVRALWEYFAITACHTLSMISSNQHADITSVECDRMTDEDTWMYLFYTSFRKTRMPDTQVNVKWRNTIYKLIDYNNNDDKYIHRTRATQTRNIYTF